MSVVISVVNVVCPICQNKVIDSYSIGFDFTYQTCSNKFSFVHCDQCDIIFLNPRPSINELSIIYPENYIPYKLNKKSISNFLIKLIFRNKATRLTKELSEDAKIIDVGCGSPFFLDRLKEIKNKNFELWGNDFSSSVCDNIVNSGYNAVSGRFEEINLNNEYFDMIFIRHVIEHIDNPLHVLEKAYNLLCHGGSLIIETPNRFSWDATFFKKMYWGAYDFPRHWTIFDPKSISNLALKVGFQVKKIEFTGSPSVWILSAHNALYNKKYVPKLVINLFNTRNLLLNFIGYSIDFFQKIVSNKTSNMIVILYKN